MRVLFSTGSSAQYMAPPLLGDEQVTCGPDWPDQRTPDGRWLSFKTPVGEYNLATLAAKLPPYQRPDLVVCLVDASWRNLPRGLNAFKCPRILLIADTHHLQSPLLGMLRYMTSEPFTRNILLYDRHHAGLLRSAGIRNLYWFPGLTFPHEDETVRNARCGDSRGPHVAFVGQSGNFHPRRSRLLSALNKSGVPVVQKSLSQKDGLRFYGASQTGFNASLNGDLNLRVFEILASGAALLTDRLSASSGLFQPFTDGRELATYESEKELVELAKAHLAHPEESHAIGLAGSRWFDLHFNAARRRADFRALAFDGVATEKFAFSPSETTRIFFSGEIGKLLPAISVYENVQEQHRLRENIRVSASNHVPSDIHEIFTTLPRIAISTPPSADACDLAIITSQDPPPSSDLTPALWCCDPTSGSNIDARLTAAGFARTHATLNTYRSKIQGPASDHRTHILLYTDDPESGGVAQYNHTILLALTRRGFRVSCVQSRSENPLITEQRALGIRHHWIDYHTGHEFARTLRDATLAEAIFEDDPPHLVIFSDCCPLSNLAAREAALRRQIPYIAVVGFVGAYLAKNFSAHLPKLHRQYDKAKAVVAVSNENLQLLRAHFGLASDRGLVIHYGRPEKFFAPRDESTRIRLRNELSIPGDAIVCLTTARLTAIKGFQHQLKAIQRLKEKSGLGKLQFVWAGEGELRISLEQQIARDGLKNRIHLIGHRWDVADWYDAADIFLLPSHLEGMPLSIMEAMAKGLPVIASAVSGIPEELGDTGKLIPDPSINPDAAVNELVQTLTLWSADPALCLQISERGRSRARELFRNERMCEQTLSLIPDRSDKNTLPPELVINTSQAPSY